MAACEAAGAAVEVAEDAAAVVVPAWAVAVARVAVVAGAILAVALLAWVALEEAASIVHQVGVAVHRGPM